MEKVYLIRRTLTSIGDAVSLEPLIAITHERVHQTGGKVWFQCDERIADFFQHHPYIDRLLMPYEQPPQDIETVLSILTPAECPSIQSLMNGGKVNATQLFCDAAQIGGERIAYDGRPPKLYFSEEEKAQIAFIKRSSPKKKVIVQMKAGHWWKAYPHLKQLVKLLESESEYQIYITNDEPIAFKHHSTPLVALKYRDLMVWLGAMDLVIGLDSGVTHLAAAVGTRTYGIYGPTDPKEILGMYGAHVSWNKFAAWRCPRKHCWLRPCKKVVCLRALSPWEVLKNCKDILAEGYQNPRLVLVPQQVHKSATQHKPMQMSRPDQVAIMRLDGLGGTLTLSDQAKKIHDQTGQKVKLITRGYRVLFEGNPHVEEVIDVGMRDWRECSIVMRNQFEAMAEVRFGIGRWHSQNGHYNLHSGEWTPNTEKGHGNPVKIIKMSKDVQDEFSSIFEQFPKDYNLLNRYGLHHIQLTDKTLGLPYDSIESKIYTDEVVDWIGLPLTDFLLVNNGVDVIHRGMRQTKCWNGWDELVKLLKCPVVQVGTLNDPLIDGVTDLRGKTNLKQAIFLLRKSKIVVVTEGGLMHLAFAASVPNVVVLGGPTQGPLFEYPGHHWINSYVCGNCWGSKDDWYERCPKDADAVCMQTISPNRVAEKVMEVWG